MGYVQDSKPLKRVKRSEEEIKKFEALAGIAPSLAMQKEALDAIIDEKNAEAEKFRVILQSLEKINGIIKSTPWDTNFFLKVDEIQKGIREGHEFDIEGLPYSMPEFMKKAYREMAGEYKIIARKWGTKKERMLDQAADMIRTAIFAKDSNERVQTMKELLVHNVSIQHFILDVVVKGYKQALEHVKLAEELFENVDKKMFE